MESLSVFTHPIFVLTLIHLVSIIGFVCATVLIAQFDDREHRRGSTLLWIFVIIFIPYLGVPLYLLLSGRKVKKVAHKKRLLYNDPVKIKSTRKNMEIQEFLTRHGAEEAIDGNQVECIPDPYVLYDHLLDRIRKARHCIWICSFIYERDEVGKAIMHELCLKAREGVQVRLLIDGMGGFFTSWGFFNPLKKAGGKVSVFLPVIPIRKRFAANLRNHRKIYIFDNKHALLGGVNIGEKYMAPKRTGRQWEDFAVEIQGPTVQQLSNVFIADWEFATEEIISVPESSRDSASDPIGNDLLQTVPSGPDSPRDVLYEGIVASIMEAKSRIWIATPYFLPDETLMRLLCSAAYLGRDVRLFVPLSSDIYLVDLARSKALRELHRSGAKVFLFKPTVLHAKIMVVDERICILGSANFDMRSLYLNYEISLFVYGKETIREVLKYLEEVGRSCVRYKPQKDISEDKWQEFKENVAWLMSPML